MLYRSILITAIVLGLATAVAGQSEADLRQVFIAFFHTKEIRIDSVPDLYPGGYARISVHAKKATLGGLQVDEIWIRLIGVSLDVSAMRAGTLQISEYRGSALHGRVALKSLEEHFVAGNSFKDIRLWAEEGYLFGEGTILYNGHPLKVWLKGSFAVGETSEVFFHVDNMRVNALPVPTFLIRKLEGEVNPVLTQRAWPVTFKIRSLLTTKDVFVISTQADPTAPCTFCLAPDVPGPSP